MLFVPVFILGLIIGSFLSVVISRLPKGEQFIGGRSYCPSCKHALRWHDLVPVLSFLILWGRCRYCRNKISWFYPIVELCSGAVWAVSFFFLSSLGFANWLFWVFVLELFLILAFIDLKHFVLADSVMAVILAAFIGYEIFGGRASGASSIFSSGNLAAALILFLVPFLVWSFSGGRGIGLGDAKLAGLIGLVFGFREAFVILYAAVVSGALFGLALIWADRGTLKTKLPLGAFISFSAILFVFLGRGASERFFDFFGYLLFKVNLF